MRRTSWWTARESGRHAGDRPGRRLETLGVGWLEEPLPLEDLAGAALDVPVAAAESCRTPSAVQALLEHRAGDVVILDIQRPCGLTGWLRGRGARRRPA